MLSLFPYLLVFSPEAFAKRINLLTKLTPQRQVAMEAALFHSLREDGVSPADLELIIADLAHNTCREHGYQYQSHQTKTHD